MDMFHSNIKNSSVNRPGNTMHSVSSHNKPFAHMACERWLHARLDNLRAKSVFNHRAEYEYLPQKLEKSFVDFNVKEKNIRGETLIMAVIRYELNKANQVRYINLLTRSGCDPSEPDERELRTPLMLACLMRNDTVVHHLILQNVNLMAADKMGNTVLMYAALYSQSSLLNFLVEELSRRWMLKKGRLCLVKRLNDQVSSNLMFAPSFNNWNTYSSIYKVKQKFLLYTRGCAQTLSHGTASPARNSKLSLPLLRVSTRKALG
ncbi:unnamed protein product [Litomosoides sigmodontis]|uniref:Uncharacterized protein n=1 Tax=Litomosoides sigmodontis TaxID=42156 RepID=A0A3P6TSM0_LITSI|nr:unnamed protein product [Litomosoides sigmodontis]